MRIDVTKRYGDMYLQSTAHPTGLNCTTQRYPTYCSYSLSLPVPVLYFLLVPSSTSHVTKAGRSRFLLDRWVREVKTKPWVTEKRRETLYSLCARANEKSDGIGHASPFLPALYSVLSRGSDLNVAGCILRHTWGEAGGCLCAVDDSQTHTWCKSRGKTEEDLDEAAANGELTKNRSRERKRGLWVCMKPQTESLGE